MSYKQQSPLPVVEGGTGTELFEMAVGKQGYGVILCGQFSTNPLEVIQDPGTAGQVLTSNGIGERPSFKSISADGAVTQITPDTGGAILPSSGNINLNAGVISQNCGSSVEFIGAGNNIILNVTDTRENTIIGLGSGNATLTGNHNTILGDTAGVALTDGINNTMIGTLSGSQITTGGVNTLLGVLSGFNYAGNEHSNICIGYSVEGVLGETNTLRIGNGTGSSPGEITQTFISGIDGVDVGSTAVVVTEFANQLGTAVITAGSGITVTPGANTITIAATGGGGGGISSIAGDAGGTQSGPAISLDANATAGSTVLFNGSANVISLHVTDTLDNTFIGLNAGNSSITGSNNIGLGSTAGTSAGSGNQNIMIGNGTGANLTSGASNIMIGANAGNGMTGGSNNIILGINAGSNGTISGNQNILIGASSGASLAGGGNNIFIGANAGATSSGDNSNIAIGINAGTSIAGGTNNTLLGNGSGASLGNASLNTFYGLNTGNSISTGTQNVIIGANAGTGYGSTESNNIVINDNGNAAAGQSNTLFIGAGTGTGSYQLNKAFIGGIRGITTGNADAIAVVIDSAGQLGTVSSSRRFKNNIQDMYDASSPIYDLRPVTFAYNSDNSGKTQYGLIAEEVEAVLPDIVVRNIEGEIETVQYHILPVLLLNEIKKLNARIAALEARL